MSSDRLYVWEGVVRLTHWVNVLSILLLSFTGFYIGSPFMHAKNETDFIMASMRFVHFLCAYFLIASLIVRIYWWFAGNKYAKLDQFLPLSSQRWDNLIGTAMFYGFMRKDLPHSPGHTGLAGITYFFLFIILIIEIMTGFALYSLSHAGSKIFYPLGGFLLGICTEGTIRLVHHLIMWCMAVFVIIHVYISVHNHIIEKNGLVWSIFSGYKRTQDNHS